MILAQTVLSARRVLPYDSFSYKELEYSKHYRQHGGRG